MEPSLNAKWILLRRHFHKAVWMVLVALSSAYNTATYANTWERISYSLFTEGGETDSVFVIDGRSFPVKIGSVGLKGSMEVDNNIDVYGKIGFGYSQKQDVSAYDFNLSGSIFSTSFGGGAHRKFPIGDSNFQLMPFLDVNVFSYSSDTFRGDLDGDKLKARVNGNSSFFRGGIELQYLTQNGHFFFGTGFNNWGVDNEVSIKTGNLTITPRVWADNVDRFFQTGVLFDAGNSDAIIGMRLSDLTFDINTQLIEAFAEVRVSFGKK